MKKLLFLGAVGLALTAAVPAFAADLPVAMPAKATFVSRFTWTGCFLGAQVGGAWERKDASDPVLLVQDGIGGAGTTVGVTTTRVGPSGVMVGGQIGCDYQFAPNFVVGIEGAAAGSTMKGNTLVGLPASLPDTALVTVKTDFLPSLTARLGYAVDHWLFYARGGAAWAGDKYSVTGTYAGTTLFDFEGLSTRVGWTVGAGVEWAFTDDWSARLEYDYADFGRHDVTMFDAGNVLTGAVSIKQTMQMVKLGVNFHVRGWQ